MSEPKRAVVLLSGGLDSATVLSWAISRKLECFALSVDYGQHCRRELAAARALAARAGVKEHQVISVALSQLGGSALMGEAQVPATEEASHRFGIPETYVPARNTTLLSIALGWAEVLGAYRVFIGANSLDYSGYPDCRPEYIAAFNRLAALAVAEGASGGRAIVVEAPLMNMTKAEIIRLGMTLGVDFSLTVSCYQPTVDGLACGRCESCALRVQGFAQAEATDPIPYAGQGPRSR